MQRATTQNQDNQVRFKCFILLDNLGQINEIKSEHTKKRIKKWTYELNMYVE